MSREELRPAATFTAEMTDGAGIVLRRYGNPDRPRLMITHGNGFAIDGYRVFWEPLLNDFDVVLFDMRNHGWNKPTGQDGHNYFQLAKDVGSIRNAAGEAWGEKKTVGVFHSMSGRAAMKHAVEMDWVWDALILYDPPSVPFPGHPEYEAMRIFELKLVEFAANRPNRFKSVDELVQLYREARGSSHWLPQAQEDMAHAVLRKSGDGYELACRREIEASIYLAALTLDLWPSTSHFGGPTKLIGADAEMKSNTPTARANRALALEGGIAYEGVPGTGHLLQIEKPAESREAMLSFLRDII